MGGRLCKADALGLWGSRQGQGPLATQALLYPELHPPARQKLRPPQPRQVSLTCPAALLEFS